MWSLFIRHLKPLAGEQFVFAAIQKNNELISEQQSDPKAFDKHGPVVLFSWYMLIF